MSKRKTQSELNIQKELELLQKDLKANDEQGINSVLKRIMDEIRSDKNLIAVTIDWVLEKRELFLLETLLKTKDFQDKISKEVLREDILKDVIHSGIAYEFRAKNVLEILKILVDKGANTNPSIPALSLLDNAVSLGDPKVVEFLINKGSPVNKSAAGGSTALHTAVKKGNYEIVKMLLENGASTSKQDGYARLPLQLAQNNEEIVRVLLEYGSPIKDFRNPSLEVRKVIDLATAADKMILGIGLEKPLERLPADAAFLVKRMVSTKVKYPEKVKLTLEQIGDFFNQTVLKGHSPLSFKLRNFFEKDWGEVIKVFKTMLILENRDTKFKECPKDILYSILLKMDSKEILPGTLTEFGEESTGDNHKKPDIWKNILAIHGQVDDSLEAVQKGYPTLGDIMILDTDS